MTLFPENSEGTARAAGLEEARSAAAEHTRAASGLRHQYRSWFAIEQTACANLTGCRFCYGLSEPSLETRLAKTRVFTRKQRSLIKLRASVPRLWVGDDFARIVESGQTAADQFIHAKLFRPRDFNEAVCRRREGDGGDTSGDIVGSHRLEEHRR